MRGRLPHQILQIPGHHLGHRTYWVYHEEGGRWGVGVCPDMIHLWEVGSWVGVCPDMIHLGSWVGVCPDMIHLWDS